MRRTQRVTGHGPDRFQRPTTRTETDARPKTAGKTADRRGPHRALETFQRQHPRMSQQGPAPAGRVGPTPEQRLGLHAFLPLAADGHRLAIGQRRTLRLDHAQVAGMVKHQRQVHGRGPIAPQFA